MVLARRVRVPVTASSCGCVAMYKSTVHQVASVAPWRLNYGAANQKIEYYVKRDDYREDGAG